METGRDKKMSRETGAGTDVEILGKKTSLDEPTRLGRPKVNRELIIRHLKMTDASGKPRYTVKQISKIAKCSKKTVSRVYQEALKEGTLTTGDREGKEVFGIVEADFDEECKRAVGYSFYDWLHTQNKDKSRAKYIFNFCSKCWEQIFEKCSLTEIKDRDSQFGDGICIKWLTKFNVDNKRIRGRKKLIRYMFRYLGRDDLCDRHLRMPESQNPRSIRKVDAINDISFPGKFQQCLNEMDGHYADGSWIIKFKTCTQMRTGDYKEEREAWGLKKGTGHKSYVRFDDTQKMTMTIFAKRGEIWDVTWLPKTVMDGLFKLYETKKDGEALLHHIPVRKFREKWGDITERIIGFRMVLHDLRKVSITWLYIMGVPLEIAIMLNVGWMDMNTAVKHYAQLRKLISKSFRQEYRKMIPDWFKDGLNDYIGEDAKMIQQSSATIFKEEKE